jgi:hypothetical protein
MADPPYRAAQLLKSTRRYWMQVLMADPKTSMADPEAGPWWITDNKPMADPGTARGGLPCSTRIGLSLGLQLVSTPVPTCSPRQAPL